MEGFTESIAYECASQNISVKFIEPGLVQGTNFIEKALENAPSLEKIRLRAYEKYIERGGTDGRDLDHWMQAERELVEKLDAS